VRDPLRDADDPEPHAVSTASTLTGHPSATGTSEYAMSGRPTSPVTPEHERQFDDS